MRAPLANELVLLGKLLPALLPGNWSPAALQASDYEQRVLIVDGQLAGFAEFFVVLDECHLLAIAIAADYQHQGLGRVLLDAVTSECAGIGCTRCLLEVRASNRAAIRFYETGGFIRDGHRARYYPPLQENDPREDALLYSCSLS